MSDYNDTWWLQWRLTRPWALTWLIEKIKEGLPKVAPFQWRPERWARGGTRPAESMATSSGIHKGSAVSKRPSKAGWSQGGPHFLLMLPEDAPSRNTWLVVFSVGEATVRTAGNQEFGDEVLWFFSVLPVNSKCGEQMGQLSKLSLQASPAEWLGSG